jgi:hypothetical protein
VPTFPENAPVEIAVVESVAATDIAQLAEVLVDCVAGGASVSYMRAGWTRVGVIPNYALFPDGSPCDTVYFWKKI